MLFSHRQPVKPTKAVVVPEPKLPDGYEVVVLAKTRPVRVRVTVQLVRTQSGTPMWAQTFDAEMTNIFAVQDSISERVAQTMMVKLNAVESLVARRARLDDSPVARLTPRELDVLREMAQGKSNPGIAGSLFLSESAVEKHINAIFSKFGLSEEPQLNRRVAAVLTFLREAGTAT